MTSLVRLHKETEKRSALWTSVQESHDDAAENNGKLKISCICMQTGMHSDGIKILMSHTVRDFEHRVLHSFLLCVCTQMFFTVSQCNLTTDIIFTDFIHTA